MPDRKVILVMDDCADVRELIRMSLAYGPYEVFEADNGEGGLRMAEALVPDLVLVDAAMPGHLNGFQVCRNLKGVGFSNDVPVIVMSSGNIAGDMIRSMQAGADKCLEKPFSALELINAVAYLLCQSTQAAA